MTQVEKNKCPTGKTITYRWNNKTLCEFYMIQMSHLQCRQQI